MKRTHQLSIGKFFAQSGRTLQFAKQTCAAALAACAIGASAPAGAADVGYYPLPAAAQEYAQVIWLAETAHACGWADAEQVRRFEAFAVRFLAAHLEGHYQRAFLALVSDSRYVAGIERAAVANAGESCAMARWQRGWTVYLAAAQENEGRY